MSAPLIGVVTLIYLAVSVDQSIKGNYGMGLCFLSYGFANIGLLMAMK